MNGKNPVGNISGTSDFTIRVRRLGKWGAVSSKMLSHINILCASFDFVTSAALKMMPSCTKISSFLPPYSEAIHNACHESHHASWYDIQVDLPQIDMQTLDFQWFNILAHGLHVSCQIHPENLLQSKGLLVCLYAQIS